jgi:hypothetical protein
VHQRDEATRTIASEAGEVVGPQVESLAEGAAKVGDGGAEDEAGVMNGQGGLRRGQESAVVEGEGVRHGDPSHRILQGEILRGRCTTPVRQDLLGGVQDLVILNDASLLLGSVGQQIDKLTEPKFGEAFPDTPHRFEDRFFGGRVAHGNKSPMVGMCDVS